MVNLVLKNRVEHTQVEAQLGQSERGDNEELRFSLLTGTDFMGGRGQVALALDYFKNNGVGNMYSRDWGRKEWGILTNPTPGDGQPVRIISPNVRNAGISPNGLITSGPLRGTTFLPDGIPTQYTFGTYAGSQYMIGGDGHGERWYSAQVIAPELERRIAYLRTSYALSDDTEFFFDGSYGWSYALSAVAAGFNFGNIVIQRDNPYLPQSVAAAMDTAGITSFNMGRAWFDVGPNYPDTSNRTWRGVTGLRGKLPRGWDWDIAVQYGENTQDTKVRNAFIFTRSTLALDAVLGTDGSIVCRSSLTDPSNGCVPFNPFGSGRASPAAYDYLRGQQRLLQKTEQTTAAVNLRGDAFDLWAGPLAVAFGLEYRKETLNSVGDELGAQDAFQFGNYKPLRGSYDTKEVYLESELPLLKGKPWADSLSLNAAARYTDYSTSGGVTTWKAGLIWDASRDIRFRVARSRDIRAPNIGELFSPVRTNPPVLAVDPFRDNATDFATSRTVGNLDLVPEEADTFTLGLIYHPAWASNLTVSIDYFDIDVQDAITTLGAQALIDRCYRGEVSLCGALTRAADGTLTHIDLQSINVAEAQARGVDIEIGYVTNLPKGTLSTRLFGTRTLRDRQSDGLLVTDLLGQYTNPKLALTGLVSYDLDRLSLTAQGRYLDGGKFNNFFVEGVDINDNKIPSVFYLNLSASYNIGPSGEPDAYQIFAAIDNALDKDPPPAPQQVTPYNPNVHDAIGRNFRIGVRARF